VRDFAARTQLDLHELNFEKTPSLRKLFVEGPNTATLRLIETHLGRRIGNRSLLFLDEVQSAPEIISRLRYFYEDTPDIAVIAAGSLLEFALAELQGGMPVGRLESLHLGPMRFEEFLEAMPDGQPLLQWLRTFSLKESATHIPEPLHHRLLGHCRNFSLVGGMPEAIERFRADSDFLAAESAQRSILETYQQDFGKYRRRIPHDRIQKLFQSLPAQVGKKWVHARINPDDKAQATDQALDALCRAGVAHRVHHSSGNGVPLMAEEKTNLFKVLFLDIGLMGRSLGLRASDLVEPESFERVNEGALSEQWIGQHLLDLRPMAAAPRLHYWVREKTGALAEVDYLLTQGPKVFPVEVKSGATTRRKSLEVFLSEKPGSPFGLHISTRPAAWVDQKRILALPHYLIEQTPRLISEITDSFPSKPE